jgi:hypothetical protein
LSLELVPANYYPALSGSVVASVGETAFAARPIALAGRAVSNAVAVFATTVGIDILGGTLVPPLAEPYPVFGQGGSP